MSAAAPLFMLAFDHRNALVGKMLPGRTERADELVPPAKELIYDGARAVLTDGDVGADRLAVLVDEQYGSAVARTARRDGVTLAVACERSGQRHFELEYGADAAAHIEDLDPDYVKVLVRYNPDRDEAQNARERAALAEVSALCQGLGRKLLFELLVPPTDAQLAAAGGDPARYDAEQRAALTVRTMEAFQSTGTLVHLWKVEGYETPEDAAAVARQAARGEVDAPIIVLGRGADDAQVDHWIRVAAATEGFAGFAIGRSIWWSPVADWLNDACTREQAVERIAASYRRAIGVWTSAVAATA
jgi:myo-inositol catabolism protein IolC